EGAADVAEAAAGAFEDEGEIDEEAEGEDEEGEAEPVDVDGDPELDDAEEEECEAEVSGPGHAALEGGFLEAVAGKAVVVGLSRSLRRWIHGVVVETAAPRRGGGFLSNSLEDEG